MYYRLSSFYFFYFLLLGALLPYWSLYLDAKGFSAQTIGLLISLLHFSRIFAPTLWGWLADTYYRRITVVRWGAALTWLLFLPIFWQHSVGAFALVMLVFSFFWNAVLPQVEVITLNNLGQNKQDYSRIRLWGSLGFIGAVNGVGYLIDHWGISALPALLLALMICIWLNSLWLPNTNEPAHDPHPCYSLSKVLARPAVLAFLLTAFLIQLSHGPYYTFFSLMLQQQGFGNAVISSLWSLGVVAEVVIFMQMHTLQRRYGIRQIMLISLLLTVLRWLLTAFFSQSLLWLSLAQLLHAASFATLHACGIALVHYYFPAHMQGRGQALFSSLGFGLGGSCGALLAGALWEAGQGRVAFCIAALAAALAGLLTYIWIKPKEAIL